MYMPTYIGALYYWPLQFLLSTICLLFTIFIQGNTYEICSIFSSHILLIIRIIHTFVYFHFHYLKNLWNKMSYTVTFTTNTWTQQNLTQQQNLNIIIYNKSLENVPELKYLEITLTNMRFMTKLQEDYILEMLINVQYVNCYHPIFFQKL